MMTRKIVFDSGLFPENIAPNTTAQSTTKLKKRRQNVLNLLGGGMIGARLLTETGGL